MPSDRNQSINFHSGHCIFLAYIVIYCAVQFLRQTKKQRLGITEKKHFHGFLLLLNASTWQIAGCLWKKTSFPFYHIQSCIVLSSRCHNLASILLYCDSKCSCEIVYVLCVFSLSPTIQSVLVNFLKNFVDNKKSTALHYDLFLLHHQFSKTISLITLKLSFPMSSCCNMNQQYTSIVEFGGHWLFLDI